MNEQQAGEQARAIKRRGILAAAGGVVAGIMAKQAAQPVIAGTDGDFVLGGANTTSRGTSIVNTATAAGFAVEIHCDVSSNGTGLIATGTSYGLSASGEMYAGVFGDTPSSTGAGVRGLARGSGTGVWGSCDAATGVLGDSVAGIGVQGNIRGGNAANTVAVYGLNRSNGANGIGVYGASAHGTGVYGLTAASNQYGILGQTFEVNSTAIAGTCTGDGSSAFSGGTTNPNAYAAFFQGTTVVQGDFAVTGAKSAVIQHPRTGDHRLVYCVESPEPWFEDFGEATLTAGTGSVTLDPDFAALIHTDDYHVFLTSYDPMNAGLAVAARSATGFAVQEQHSGTSGGRFSWRVVGKRADVKGERLSKFVMPNLPLPDPAKFKAPNLPTPTVPPQKP